MTKEGGITPVSSAHTSTPVVRGDVPERPRMSPHFKPSVDTTPQHELSDRLVSRHALKETRSVWAAPKEHSRSRPPIPEMVFPIHQASVRNSEPVHTLDAKTARVFGSDWEVMAKGKPEVTIFTIPSVVTEAKHLETSSPKKRQLPTKRRFHRKSVSKEPSEPRTVSVVASEATHQVQNDSWRPIVTWRTRPESGKRVPEAEHSKRSETTESEVRAIEPSQLNTVPERVGEPWAVIHTERIERVRVQLSEMSAKEPKQDMKPTPKQKERQEHLVTVQSLQKNMPDGKKTPEQKPTTALEKQHELMLKRQELALQKIQILDTSDDNEADQEHKKRMNLARAEKDDKEYIRDEATNQRRIDQLLAIYDTLSPDDRRSPQEIALRMPKEQPEPLKSKIVRSVRGLSTDYSYYWFIDLFKKSKPIHSREELRQSAELATATYSAADYGRGKSLSWEYVKTFVLAISTAGIQTIRK